jgi:hypothetical protein
MLAVDFPAVGHKYVVTFTARDGSAGFRVQLDFHSPTSMTYARVRPDGTVSHRKETVDITVEPLKDDLFLVTWTERQGTTVVHLEDYGNLTIITNVISPTDEHARPECSKFKFHGTMTQVA